MVFLYNHQPQSKAAILIELSYKVLTFYWRAAYFDLILVVQTMFKTCQIRLQDFPFQKRLKLLKREMGTKSWHFWHSHLNKTSIVLLDKLVRHISMKSC